MSELIKTFSFDLQRFAITFGLYGNNSVQAARGGSAGTSIVGGVVTLTGGYYPLVSLASDISSSTSGSNASIGAFSIVSGNYFWASRDDSIGIVGNGTPSVLASYDGKAQKQSFTYEYYNPSVTGGKSSGTAEYYTVALSNIKTLSNLDSVTGINFGGSATTSLSFGLGRGSLSNDDKIELSNGAVAGITLGTASKGSVWGAGVSVGANQDYTSLKINGGTVKVTGGFGYIYGDKNNQALVINPTADTNVENAGKATRINLASQATYNPDGEGINILGNTYYVGGQNSYFNLNKKGEVAGFTFGDTSGASLGGEVGGKNLALSYSNNASVANGTATTIKAPTLSGSDASYLYIASVGTGSAAPSLSVGVTGGGIVQFAGYGGMAKTVTVSVADSDSKISLGTDRFSFDAKGALTSVTGFNEAGELLTFTGAKATAAAAKAGGIAVGPNGSILAVGSGNFVFGQNAEGDTTTGITLKSGDDTVWGSGTASILSTEAESGSIYFYDDNAKNKLSFTNLSGNASFSLDGANHSVAGFTFGGVGDAITRTQAVTVLGTGLQYINASDTVTALPGVGVSLASKTNPYTITYTDNTENAEKFQVSGLDGGATVSVSGGAGAQYTFTTVRGGNASKGGVLEFSEAGATAVSLTGGALKFDSAAAASLAAAEEATEDQYFSINGKGVNIGVNSSDTDGVIYDFDKKALKDLDGGATIAQAGEIEKVYVNGAGNTSGSTEQQFAFGDDETGQAFTVLAAKSDTVTTGSAAFFNVSGTSATGFVFGSIGDAITGNFSGLKLYNGESDTVGFAAPEITTIEDGEAVTEATITKIKTGSGKNTVEAFQITVNSGLSVALDSGTGLTFTEANNGASIQFSAEGDLIAINGLTESGDALTVSKASSAVSLGTDVVEIEGGEFTYQKIDNETSGSIESALVDLKPGSAVKQSKGIGQLWTAGGKEGNGTFKFGSASFAIAGVDNDTTPADEAEGIADRAGVMFQWDDTNKKATAINSLDENTSVTGNFNGMSIAGGTEALNVTDGTYVLFGGGKSMAGLAAGGEVVAAGGVSDFLTNAAASAKFTVLKTELTVTDKDGVTFQTNGKDSLLGVAALEGEVVGDFTGGLSVNSVAVSVTNDSVVAVVGDDKGVTAVNQLGVADATAKIEVTAAGASVFGVNENGTFVFNGAHSFAVAGNGDSVTSFDFTAETAAITGVDATETLSGDFSAATSVNGNVLQVAGDSSISLVGGTQILGLTGGASVMQANGISSAVTDGIGKFTFTSGGQSQAFEVSGSGDGVEFILDGKGKVVGISGVDDGEVVTGDLNGITINNKAPEIIVNHADGTPNTNLYYENGTLSGIVDGDTVVKADNVKTVIAGTSGTFNFADKSQTFTTTDADGVVFSVVEGTTEVTAVASLAAAASLEGSIGGLSVNGKKVDIQNDTEFGVIGAADGIDGVYKLSDGAIVVDAAGATVASTDSFGTFQFQAKGQSFVVAGDSGIDFALTDNAVTAINGLSAGSVLGSFSGVTGVNGQTFAVADSDNKVEVFADAEGNLSKIDKVTADATIGEVGSVSQVVTDKAGKFTFSGGVSFTTGDGADVVTFGLSSSKVVSISDLNGSAIGGFSGIKVNGADIDIVDGDNQLKVFGDGKVLTAIQDVDADATITKAGGVAELVGNISASSGTFTFANSGEFKVEGDSSVTFALNTAKDAEVVGISDLNGAVTGSFSGISAVNGKTFSVVDADGVLTVYGDGSDITKIAGVTGSASIGQVGGVSQILTDKAGEFAFTNGSWSVAGDDNVTFGMSSSKVVSIAELVGTVTGAFEDVTVNGKSFQISGDSSIALVGGASGVTAIEKLSGGADIARAEGYLTATTDSEGTFTFANGRTIQVLGDSSVVFGLNNGLVMSIDELDETATIIGAINQIAINGSSSMFDVRNNANLWYSNGTLSAVVDGNTIVSADGATTVQVATDGTYTFGNGAFQILGDQDGVAQFTVSDSSIATAINGVDAGATVTGALNGMAINGGASLVVENDETFGAVAGDGVLAKLINLSDGANVVNAGGASQFVTEAEGQFTILGTAMQIEGDDSVTFTAGASGITAIDGLAGTATGDFQKVIAVNTNNVQVLNDSVVAVSSEGAEVTAINQVSGGATVAAVGGAAEVGTDTAGKFTFAVAGDSQAFTVENDADVTFQLEDGVVVGVNELEEGKLTFDTNTKALTLNDDEIFTIETSTNASFSVADNSVNYVTGVDGAIDGLVNATVVATGAMEVNGTNIDVQDDADFKVIVQDGEVVGLADISGGAKVNVSGVSIAVDTNGELEIGGKQYSFNDSIDGAFNLTTGEESALTGVDAFAGEMVIAAPADQALTVNGDALGFLSTADSVTVNSDGVEVTAVNGLVNNDAVTVGAGASIAMPGSTASVRGEGAMLTVNEVTYELLNDADGITVTGGRQVTDLNESASLFVSEKGKYTVNGNTSDIEVEDTNMPIIGLDNATDAYIYDPAHLIVRKSTPVGEIETMLGLPTEYETKFGGDDVNHENDDPTDDPLNSAGLSAMFANADLNQPLEIFATNDEKTAQDIPLAGTDFSKKVHLFRGDQNVTFNNAGGNLAVVESESSGTKNIALGDMGDAVISKADAGDGSQVNVVGGAGDDSVVVQGSAPVNFDMSEGGADKLVTFASSNARIALSGYDALANPNAGVHIAERWASLADAITAGLLNFANGVMSIGTDPNANAQIDLGTNIVNLFNYLGQKQAVGFTNDAGGLVDASTAQDPVILIGNDKGQKTGDSTLLGGSGDDTAIAGGGDNIDLGAGNNEVRLQQDINRAGADVTLAQGRTTITGFIGSFNAQHGDMIKTDLSNANVSFVDGNVIIEGDGFYGVIADAITNGELVYDTATDVTESADLVESADSSSASVLATAQGDYTNVLFDDEGVISKTAIAKEGGVIDVKLDFDARPNNFIGNNSGITFYDHTGEVLVNLADGAGSIDTEAVTYSGINKVAAGAGQTTMIGGESNETLIAGQGNNSVWGAGGKNFLLGYNDVNNDKTGQTSFFVVAEKDGAANTVRGFNFVDDDSWNVNTNQITADKLDIQVQYDYIDADRDVDISGDDVVLFVNNRNKESSESVVIEGARGKNFVVSGNDIVNDVVAQVNTDSLVADKFANFFVATGKNATLTVSNDVDTANIYLDNKTPDGSDYLGDVPQFYGDIHVIDASGSNAKVELGGNLYDNTIIGGTGDASLWGGDGGNDLLVGGTGANTFFYNAGDGNDTITGAHDGDIVDLTNVQLSDIVDANSAITSSGVELKFKDGGSLTVNSTADVAYKVGEDTYVVNDDRDGWTKK